jgi:hypothetical protein
MEMIKIGKREISKEFFIQAVANNNSLTKIIEAIGWNPIPTTTRENVLSKIEELELDTSHIKQLKRVFETTTKIKEFTLTETNKQYLDSFLDTIANNSRPTYKASCGNFLEKIDKQDFITVTEDQILEFASTRSTEATKRNVESHIRSMLIYCVNNNINGAIDKVDKQLLLWLIRK